MRIGPEDSGKEFALNGAEAVFTSGVSLSMVPRSLSANFFKRYLDGLDYFEDNGVFYTDCSTVMHDLWFMFEEHWIQIRGEDLLTDISYYQDNSLCIFNFLPSVDDFWVLGNTVYKDYYVYHSPDELVMKWTPTSSMRKTPLKLAAIPTASLEFYIDA